MARILEINDFSDTRLDVYARLNERQLLNRDKPEEGMFIAESPKVIDRALDAGCVPLTLLLEPAHIEGEAKGIIERCGDIPVFTAPMNVLEQITGYKLTRGVLCCMRRPPLRTAAEVCKNATRVAVLEDVMNPTNVGAIFRCAAALGMDAVLLTKASSDPLYRRSIRVSMGTVFQVPWAFLGDSPLFSAPKVKESNGPPSRNATIRYVFRCITALTLSMSPPRRQSPFFSSAIMIEISKKTKRPAVFRRALCFSICLFK